MKKFFAVQVRLDISDRWKQAVAEWHNVETKALTPKHFALYIKDSGILPGQVTKVTLTK